MAKNSPGAQVQEPAAIFVGQRERNKRDKLLRIKIAARDLFVSRGYDDTTTREIALRAGVGMGTVFTYADNKRDLLFLIANEDLEQTNLKAASEISARRSLMENLLSVFRNHYEYFAQQPDLSRLMLREMLFYDSGQQANRFKTTREKVISLICRSVEIAQADKTIRTTADSRTIGWMLFCVYQVDLRRWLAANELDLETGIEQLIVLLRCAIVGMSPAESALTAKELSLSTRTLSLHVKR